MKKMLTLAAVCGVMLLFTGDGAGPPMLRGQWAGGFSGLCHGSNPQFLPPDRLLGISSACSVCGYGPVPLRPAFVKCDGSRYDSCNHPRWSTNWNGDPIGTWFSHGAQGTWACGMCPICPPRPGAGGGEGECDDGMDVC